ncbi:MAG: polyprenol monophosphomannose synthase [Armatimonadota bacterium]
MQFSPAPDPARTLVVIPTYNEREGLRDLARAVLSLPGGWNLLIVDDNSPDGTGRLADELAAEDRRLTVLHRPGKEGLGPAYIAGFNQALARPEIASIAQMDADFSHDPADLPRLLDALSQADVAIGSRYVVGGRTEGWSLRRRMLSRWGNAYVRAVLSAPIHDLTAGFRVWRRSALEAVNLSAVTARGYGFQIEMALRALAAGCRLVEVPICFTERRAGQSKMSGSIITEALVLPWRLRKLRHG